MKDAGKSSYKPQKVNSTHTWVGRMDVVVASKYFLLLLATSFIGWAWEVLLELTLSQKFVNRGFMTMPFCPIYGCSLFAVYFLLGTPSEGRGILKNVQSKALRVVLYASFAFLIPTAAEFLVGWFFHRFFSLRLWSYQGFPYNVQGYICLPVSILWAVAVILFMEWVFPFLKKWIFRNPNRLAVWLAVFFVIAVAVDMTASFTRV